MLILFTIVWLAIGVYSAGKMFSYFYNKYNSVMTYSNIASQRNLCIVAILTGPISLFSNYITLHGVNSYKWMWPWSKLVSREK